MSLLNYCETELQREVIEAYERLGSSDKAAKELGREAGNVRNAIRIVKRNAEKAGVKDAEPRKAKKIKINEKGVVVVSAQNDTPIHNKFMDSLELYCKHKKYRLVVIPFRYRNDRASVLAENTWHKRLAPYICEDDLVLFDKVTIFGSLKIRPTASDPLSSLDTMSGDNWAVFGHAKIAKRSIATRQGDPAKLLWTTGAITRPNYTDTKEGKKGEFHHVIGALVVDKQNGSPQGRNLISQSDGSFYDLDKKYMPDGVVDAPRASIVRFGDLHGVNHCSKSLKKAIKIVRRIKPRIIALDDVLDFESGSHHNKFFDKFRNKSNGRGCVKKEIEATCALLDKIADETDQLAMVASNHNDHFTLWLENHKNADDLDNAVIFAETRAYYLGEIAAGREPKSPLEFWASKLCQNYSKMRFLGRFDSFCVNGVDHSFHGDKGSGGARGSTKNLSKIGAKVTKNHDHKSEIIDGCYSCGTMSILNPRYTAGTPSPWVNSMVIQYSNSKRTHYDFF